MIPCPAGCWHGMVGYDRRKKPIACKECGGTGEKALLDEQTPKR